MKISIIIPVYNAEMFLRECLDSVVSQTIVEKEILCIDDGSSDASFEILGQYRKQYPYIRVFRQENKGAGEARNIGLKEAVGDYVCFLDADDFYLADDALERLVGACESNHLKACAGLRKLYQNNLLEDFYLYRELFDNGKNMNGIILKYRDYQDEYHYQNYIFSSKVIKENKITFPLYRRYQDAPFFLKLMTIIKEYMVLPVEFYGYRFPEEAITRKETYIEDTLKGIRDNIKTAQENYLYELERKLVDRIGLEYVTGIIKGANKEILDLLLEIQTLIFGENGEKEFEEMQENAFDNVISIVSIIVKRGGMVEYFEKNGITNIAIYGLGNYGKIIIEELRKSKRIKLYGVDRKIKEMAGIEIGMLEEVNRKCDDIIVTPVKDNKSIVKSVRKVWNGNVWGLNTLLQKIKSMYYI